MDTEKVARQGIPSGTDRRAAPGRPAPARIPEADGSAEPRTLLAGGAGASRLLKLQRSVGNHAVMQLIGSVSRGQRLQRQIDDDGRTGEASLEGAPVVVAAASAAPTDPQLNDFGEQTGHLSSNVTPHVFVDGGKTGSALDNTVGGRGGSGDQNAGDITLVAPQYESRAGTTGDAGTTPARAWVRPGTGTATVTRSYHGSLTGANGRTLWMTARAVARTDAHEVLHVQSSRGLHATHIAPLEARIARHHTEATALSSGATAVDAQNALQTFINWNATIDAFRNADIAANQPGGSVDTADVASPTFLRDYGPRRVNRVNYQHYFDTPPGPAAGPTAPP